MDSGAIPHLNEAGSGRQPKIRLAWRAVRDVATGRAGLRATLVVGIALPLGAASLAAMAGFHALGLPRFIPKVFLAGLFAIPALMFATSAAAAWINARNLASTRVRGAIRAVAGTAALAAVSVALILVFSPFIDESRKRVPIIGAVEEFSAGPYGFFVTPISFQGRDLGYARALPPPQRFSDRFWVFESCARSSEEDGIDECSGWRLLDVTNGKVDALNLTGYQAFFAEPAFSWPYVAYVVVGAARENAESETVACTVYNHATKRVEKKVTVTVPGDFRATDFPGMFLSPSVRASGRTTRFTFHLHHEGNLRDLCAISVP